MKFEIGHVLFIDIVGYSKLLINEQRDQIQKLKAIVRGTEQFRVAEAEGKLLRLPTGDGGALGFSDYSGSTGVVRNRDQQGAEESSRTSHPDGHSQRSGQ